MEKTLIGFLLLVSPSVFAVSVFDKVTPEQPICYGREYSAEYLKSRPKQTVQKILAKFSKDAEYNQNLMTVEITLKGKKHFYKNYRSLLFCDKNDDCYVECDGGSASVSLQQDGRMHFKNNGFAIQGGCGSEEEDGFLLKPTVGGDDRFRLIKIPSGFCQKAPDYLRE
ncbi:hypothetical protein [Bdellovibrio sp. HCB337]|uniref:hypothetical protein n=1 Tax=Bdellovibrio sp. HCB337 TaxID=3394358 RepID=UPI0039A6F99B